MSKTTEITESDFREDGYKLYGFMADSQEEAQAALASFIVAGKHTIKGKPEMFYNEKAKRFKVRVVAKPR